MKLGRLFNVILLAVSLFSLPAMADTASILTPITDTAITGIIKTKVAMDPSISNSQINISTTSGVVSLSGTLSSDSDASAMIQIAQSVSGVKAIDASKLKVAKSTHPFSDLMITAEIKGLFIREKLFGNKDVSVMSIIVETNNGVVSLTGTADDQIEADNAVKLAKTVKGVKSVESRIQILRT